MPALPIARLRSVLNTALALGIAGCASSAPLPQLVTGVVPSKVEVPPTEVYQRIARGANACWFGAQGPLSRTHIFYADADPPAQGAAVEILVHERVADQPKPWGLKAFRVALHDAGGQSGIAVENLRMPGPVSEAMQRDVHRWANGGEGCKSDGLQPVEPPPELVPAKAPAKSKGRTPGR